MKQEIHIPIDQIHLEAILEIPNDATGLVIFAHGSGSSCYSPRNQFVAAYLNSQGVATLLVDLLTSKEEVVDSQTGELRFNIELLASRLIKITDWISKKTSLPLAYFGASTGAAAALIASAAEGKKIAAVVSRGGRPDLANKVLAKVTAPILLIVGGDDEQVIKLNRESFSLLHCKKNLEIIPGATHLFEEPGCLEKVAKLSCDWFKNAFD